MVALILLLAAGCFDDVDRVVASLPPAQAEARILELIARCDSVPQPLRQTAARAARSDAAERAAALAETGACKDATRAPALPLTPELERQCSRPKLRMTNALRPHLDRGTYAFTLALHDAGVDLHTIQNLLLAAAKGRGHRR